MDFRAFLEARAPAHTDWLYQRDIKRGISKEAELIDRINNSNCGYKLVHNTNSKLDRSGIDAYLEINGKRIPVQIKTRNISSDIGYEVSRSYNSTNPKIRPNIQDILDNLNGRDMKDVTPITINMDSNETDARFISTAEGHELIKHAITNWLNSGDDYSRKWTDPNGVELVMKYDDRDRYWKVIGYVPLNSFRSVKICKLPPPKPAKPESNRLIKSINSKYF